MRFTSATQIQPRNGQMLNDINSGLEGNFRAWSNDDFEAFPQAHKQLGVDQCLVVDRSDNMVYAVSVNEASENSVVNDTIEISDGVLAWTPLL